MTSFSFEPPSLTDLFLDAISEGQAVMNGVLRRVWLVARREWNQRARTRAFRISTLISIGIVVA